MHNKKLCSLVSRTHLTNEHSSDYTLDNFGAPVIVPIIIGIIALILRVKPQKAFLSGLYAAVSLEGISLMLGSFTPIISPLVQNMGNVMVHVTGVKLNVFDVGWQAASLVAFSTSAGMIYLGLGILIQTILFLVKWTKCFQASDLWNNYSYMVWGGHGNLCNWKLPTWHCMYGVIELI